MKTDYSELVGCWIDGAIARNSQEIAERLSQLAACINADSDQLAHEPEDLDVESREMWLQDTIDELDQAINNALNPHGFLAVWEAGDYILLHQSEYFESESDYLTMDCNPRSDTRTRR